MTRPLPGVDPGLLARFREAGARIAWRAGPASPPPARGHRVRIAHLHDEEARVESWGRAPRGVLEVDSGPVGALVLLLETDRRAELPTLATREAGVDPGFAQGAIVARWRGREPAALGPTLRDLVELARYALA